MPAHPPHRRPRLPFGRRSQHPPEETGGAPPAAGEDRAAAPAGDGTRAARGRARPARPEASSRRTSRASRPSSRPGGHRARRPKVPAGIAVPAALALAYCLYAAFVSGDNGWSAGLSWLIALVSAAVLFVVCVALGRAQHGRQPETVGAAYGVVGGIALGYLLSLNDSMSILDSVIVSVLCGAALGASVYYAVHTNRTNRRSRAAEAARHSGRTATAVRRRPAGARRAPAATGRH